MRRKKVLTLISSICLVLVLAALPFLTACPAPEEEEAPPGEEEEEAPPEEVKLPDYLVTLGDDHGIQYVRSGATNDVVERSTGIKMLFQLGREFGIGIPLLQSGEAQVYRGAMYDFYQMYHGIGKASEFGKTNIRLVMPGYKVGLVWWIPSALQEKHNIKTLSDLAGLGLRINEPLRGKHPHLDMLFDTRMEFYGLTEDDFLWIPAMGKPEQQDALGEGRLDIIRRGPTPGLLKVKQSVGLYPIPATEEEIRYIIEEKGQIWNGVKVFPAGYAGLLDNDLLAVGPAMGLICIESLSDDTVYAIVQAVYEHLDELVEIHDSFEDNLLEPAGLSPYTTVPYHPGAIKYFEETGVWTKDLEALQQRLLAEQ